MNAINIAELLYSLDAAQLGAVGRLLDSRLLARKRGGWLHPTFERVAQLTDNERYLLIREIPDNTVAEALKAGGEYLRGTVFAVMTKTRRKRVSGIMTRLGPTRLSVAEGAIDAILAVQERLRAIGAISPDLTVGEIEQGLTAICAGLPASFPGEQLVPAEYAATLHQHLCGASDQALCQVVTRADPSDLALFLLQRRSRPLAERLLTAGPLPYLRETLAAALALQPGADLPDGRPEWRLWTVTQGSLPFFDGAPEEFPPPALSTPTCASGASDTLSGSQLAPTDLVTSSDQHHRTHRLDYDSTWPTEHDIPKTPTQLLREREIEASPFARMKRRCRSAELSAASRVLQPSPPDPQ
ncbi:hypothetical protein OPU71_16940 [Niveibacterium sp. 24ML]|uniref:FliG C-terminal domain-containing protein n=1 Tax=Niveibacterium sp. 24ML TaxID=2985512 RepID=UPI0022715970|nr:FliG C-terminal domain-containing protein [Niveibacterium sp. 24ML]MCX9157812.1 hypothetical protein [Niveibacterium sp. 24ML]